MLNLQLHGDEMSAEAVARAIGDRKVLLILDNCEHVIDAAADDGRDPPAPLSAHDGARDEPRGAAHRWRVRLPRAAAGGACAGSAGVGRRSRAQRGAALRRRTRSLRADFLSDDDKLPEIAAICRQLDGIPLAIEFAAARAATLGIEQVAGRLDDRFALLTGGRRTALPRHQTLRAALDWSYELLPEPERRLLRHLAVFPAGFTLEAATAVAGDAESNVALDISSLVSKSLVTLDGSETSRRWRLLETVRVYSFEKLTESGEHGRIVRRLTDFCVSLFAPFAREDELQAAIDDLGRYSREVDNLRAALTWAFSPAGDAALGHRPCRRRDRFLDRRIAHRGVPRLGREGSGAIGDAGTRSEMVLECSLGIALIYTQGMSAQARSVLLAALDLARRLEDFDYQQRSTCGLWLVGSIGERNTLLFLWRWSVGDEAAAADLLFGGPAG